MSLFAYQFREFRFTEESAEDSAANLEKTEWAFARLKWNSSSSNYFRGWWAMDYPKADRQFVQGNLVRLIPACEAGIVFQDDRLYVGGSFGRVAGPVTPRLAAAVCLPSCQAWALPALAEIQ